jgi:hypothetical protein
MSGLLWHGCNKIDRQEINILYFLSAMMLAGQEIKYFARSHDFLRYAQSSFKGSLAINWAKKNERLTVLDSLVAECQRARDSAGSRLKDYPNETGDAKLIVEAATLPSKMLLRDVRHPKRESPKSLTVHSKT